MSAAYVMPTPAASRGSTGDTFVQRAVAELSIRAGEARMLWRLVSAGGQLARTAALDIAADPGTAHERAGDGGANRVKVAINSLRDMLDVIGVGRDAIRTHETGYALTAAACAEIRNFVMRPHRPGCEPPPSPAADLAPALVQRPGATRLPIGVAKGVEISIDLERLIAGRMLVQGSSGAGKSQTLRRLVEEAFEYVPVIVVDPEGEFDNLAEHIGATTLRAPELAADGLTSIAWSARRHGLALHLDLSDLDADERIVKASAFFAGLLGTRHDDIGRTVLVVVDEAHLLAPHAAGSARDAATRRLGVSSLAELCSRGRKRGIGTVIATQRLAKLASSVTSELHNSLIGLNVLDIDVARAADRLGFSSAQAERLKELTPGEFYALGPALSLRPVLTTIGATATQHTGATPELSAPAELQAGEARALLGLEALRETGSRPAAAAKGARAGGRALDAFLLDPAAATAARAIEALKKIAPNAATVADLSRHLGVSAEETNTALDLLASAGAIDTMPRGENRIARLAGRLRVLASETPVVSLA
jgi:hypothetical protein